MKKLVLNSALVLGLIAGSTAVTSCDRAVEEIVDSVAVPLPFAVKPNIPEQTIPFASIPTSGYYSIPVTLDIDLNQEIKNQSSAMSINNLKSAKLESMNIVLAKSTLNAKLDAIKSARLYVKTPNLDRVLVATADGAQISPDKIEFTAVDAELIEYFKSNKNSLDIDMQGAKIAVGEMTLKINPSFRIMVGI